MSECTSVCISRNEVGDAQASFRDDLLFQHLSGRAITQRTALESTLPARERLAREFLVGG